MGWLNQNRNLPMLRQLGSSSDVPAAPVLTGPATTPTESYDIDWTPASGFPFSYYRVYKGETEFGVYTIDEETTGLDHNGFGTAWWYIAPYDLVTNTESNPSNRIYVEYIEPSPPTDEYLQPDGVGRYLQPDGVSTYLVP